MKKTIIVEEDRSLRWIVSSVRSGMFIETGSYTGRTR